jgi:exodeoxyribonuclease VII large subunit
LEAEGLFDEERKRPLPAYPQRIGIVTSPTGAALQDMLNTLAQRYPMAEVTVAPSAVQGEDAPAQIVAAIQALNRQVHPDVILLARGGGSLEDLWAFNDEQVVRAVVASTAPVVTGVGHETDFTLVDFASDLRAPTPTGAAVLATPNRADLMNNLNTLYGRLAGAFAGGVQEQRAAFRETSQRLAHNSPLRLVQNNRQSLDALWQRCEQTGSHALQLRRAGLNGAHQRLNALSPLAVLQRGYAILSRPDGTLVTSVGQTAAGEALQARLADGSIDATVTATHLQAPTRERKEA